MKQFRKGSRKWLNPKGHWDSGAIDWSVSANGGPLSLDASLSIWDCGKKITLNFDSYSLKDVQQRARKLNLLISELEAMRAALGQAYELVEWEKEEQSYNDLLGDVLNEI